MTERRSVQQSELDSECEEASLDQEVVRLELHQLSPALRKALEQAEPGISGMRTVRAIGPQGQRYTAGLYDGRVYLLELPWPNPRNECRQLSEEPQGLDWQPHREIKYPG